MTANGGLIVTTSWDDGTEDDIKLAELLNKHGISGTFYICRSPSKPDLLQEDEIVRLDSNFEIGAHTINHIDLTKISHAEASEEIHTSKIYLEDLLGHSVSMFCYPFGRYNDAVRQMVKSNGFLGARTCDPRGLSLAQDPYCFHITLQASNGSPLMTLRIWLRARFRKIKLLFDWENLAKSLFDSALEKGGIYHIYGHSVEIERNNEWDKLERVLAYISSREKTKYMTNGEILEHNSR